MESKLPEQGPSRFRQAYSAGYGFSLDDGDWVLDRNWTARIGNLLAQTDPILHEGLLNTLAFFASTRSPAATVNLCYSLQYYLRVMRTRSLSSELLISYRSLLAPSEEHRLGKLRGLLRKWHELGYPGVDDEMIRLLKAWRLKGNRKGDDVKRQDPKKGSLSTAELQAFNEQVVQAYEQNTIDIRELAVCLLTSNTGRRSDQIAWLRIGDLAEGANKKEEPVYLLSIPKAKEAAGPRQKFALFKVSPDLWAVVSAQARNAIRASENALGFSLQAADRQQLPLFPNIKKLALIKTPHEFRTYVGTDKLHLRTGFVTETLKRVVKRAAIHSERTGELLHINARRFRRTVATRAAREGYGVEIIAELLDHETLQNAGVYVENDPAHVKRLDEAVSFQLVPFAQAFLGTVVDSERQARRGDDPRSRIRRDNGAAIGTCGEYGFCGANVPVPCYTCMHFQPWLDGPHEELYQSMLAERERMWAVTGDAQVTSVLDRSINAVAQVVQLCAQRKREITGADDLP